ncbi:alpha-E domain-containing protein [Azospirillum melinis]|uniref:Alpha-E domain-containing protein n=1 Tax=Azospirillum melinis TaxID=328839 RepID=A0ABX2KJJ8_9PROT|nr:alpha-E domain-containing protein [Azospirillum melinis]MBP2304385.1 putative alpha-E superfamily protein [Azospirillum melinis]NUB00850.1 alpha-E domain-containing protein [Azospirillum melinis]
MNLLSRYAECIFWMARYMERAENLARILDVHETFARDTRGATNWFSIVQLNADEKDFFSRHDRPTAEAVVHYYMFDSQNHNSLLSMLRMARENARTLRPWISTEMWTQINVFHNKLLEMSVKDVAAQNLSKVCTWIKEECQTHTGITEGTFYRDQGWYFYQMGKYIERADQTTRLLDIKYHTLLPSPVEVGSTLDVSQWTTVLRCTAGYHAFRRVYPRGMSPATVAGFMLYNEGFPRSVVMCVRQIDGVLTRMRSRYDLRGGSAAMERVDELLAALLSRPIDAVLRDGLHEYLDWIQLQLNIITTEIAQAFFGVQPPLAVQSQSQ